MSVATVGHTIRYFVADGLLTASNPDVAKGDGPVFQVHLKSFEANYQLPDLITRSRRARN